jgi:hypothetical protein
MKGQLRVLHENKYSLVRDDVRKGEFLAKCGLDK